MEKLAVLPPEFADIGYLLPHKPPMLLVDKLIDWGDQSVETAVYHRDASLFSDEKGAVPAWVGLEYMAQTIGVLAGIRARLAGRPLRLGLLMGTRRYAACVDAFLPGQEVRVSAKEVLVDDNNLGVFDCEIVDRVSSDIIATAQIKAIQPDNLEELLQLQSGEAGTVPPSQKGDTE